MIRKINDIIYNIIFLWYNLCSESNKKVGEVMFTKEMAEKIDKFLHDNVDIIFDFEFNGLMLLYGGAVKSLIMDVPVRDLDFVLLTQDEDNILEFINKYNLQYYIKLGYVYKIKYNGYQVDIISKKDLYNNEYNTDFLFYDIHRKQFIPFGIRQAIEKNQVIILDYYGYPRKVKRKHMRERMIKAKKFIQFMNKSNKKVKVVGNFRYFGKLLLSFIKKPSKIIKIFMR